MPTKAILDAFTAQVISGDHIGAIRDWYHADAWMQENHAPPIQGGRDALIKRETVMMDRRERCQAATSIASAMQRRIFDAMRDARTQRPSLVKYTQGTADGIKEAVHMLIVEMLSIVVANAEKVDALEARVRALEAQLSGK